MGVKLRHAAALVLIGWCIMLPLSSEAQGYKILEIPVEVRPNQPSPDPTFVGIWCGYEQFKSYKSEPVGPEPHGARRGSTRCYAFRRNGHGVALNGGLLGSPGQHFVSQSAKAVSAREVIVTTISETEVPPIHAMVGMILDFKLGATGSAIKFTRTLRLVETDTDLSHVTTVTSQYGGTQHRGTPSEIKAYNALMSGQRYVGGGDVAVPGAK